MLTPARTAVVTTNPGRFLGRLRYTSKAAEVLATVCKQKWAANALIKLKLEQTHWLQKKSGDHDETRGRLELDGDEAAAARPAPAPSKQLTSTNPSGSTENMLQPSASTTGPRATTTSPTCTSLRVSSETKPLQEGQKLPFVLDPRG